MSMEYRSIHEGKKPLPLDKMSLTAYDKDISANKEKNIDKKSKLENQARMIRMAMNMKEQKNVHGNVEVPSTNLASLVKKASKRLDKDADGDVDKDDRVNEEGLQDWFGKSKSKEGKKGWVNVVTGDSCASDKPGEGIPKCVSSEKRASMSRKERLAAAAAKRREDPNQQEKSGASAPTMVKTDRKVRKEEVDIAEAKDKPGAGSGKKDACYHKVKSRYDVWPSAYASGSLVKCRKVGAANWGSKSESVDCEDCKCDKCNTCPVCEKSPCICSEELKEAIKRLDAINGNLVLVMVFWRGKNYVHRMFFAQTRFPSRQEVIDQINKVYPGCRLLRYKVADFNPGMLLQVREGIDKDSMACNKPKAQSHGSGETGKSHVVKACEGGKEKIIRFGQKGVKGSPKKEGESKEYASRRERFKSRHAKNISKGKMSAAFWANKVKW